MAVHDLATFAASEYPRVLLLDDIPVAAATGRRHYCLAFMHAADVAIEDGKIVKNKQGVPGGEPDAAMLERAFRLTPEISRREVEAVKRRTNGVVAAFWPGS